MKNNILILILGILFFNLLIVSVLADSNILVTHEQALSAISNAENIIAEMTRNNFSIIYMNDVLTEAKLLLKQAEYAEVLRNSSSSIEQQNEARMALSLIDWRNINYSGVLKYTNEIELRKSQAFEISDEIALNQISIERYLKKGISMEEPTNLLNQSRIAFYADRYDEAKDLLKQTRASIDSISSELSLFNSLKNSLVGFIQLYWRQIFILLFILFFIFRYFFKKYSIFALKKKIIKMNFELKSIDKLIRITQTERFKENKISGLVYNIRMKKYQERAEQIKADLPVLESDYRELVKRKIFFVF